MGDRKLAKHFVSAMKALQRCIYFSIPSAVRKEVYSRQEVDSIDEDAVTEGLTRLGLDKEYEGEIHDGRSLIMERAEDHSVLVGTIETVMEEDTLIEDGFAYLYALEKEIN